jgi:hypothetical protein
VSFSFLVGTDTPSAVSQEMMTGNIIENEDMVIVASKISHLVDVASKGNFIENDKCIRFKVRTGHTTDLDEDMEKLRGFAQLTIED